MARILFPCGDKDAFSLEGIKENYKSFPVFIDDKNNNLYYYDLDKDEWILLGGDSKQPNLIAGKNLEKVKWTNVNPQGIRRSIDVLDTLEDITLKSITLTNSQMDYFGVKKLGVWNSISFIPLFKIKPNLETFVGGKVLINTNLGEKIFRGVYSVSAHNDQTGMVIGGDECGGKYRLAICEVKGELCIGLRAPYIEGKQYPPTQVEIWFKGWKLIPEECMVDTDVTMDDLGVVQVINDED